MVRLGASILYLRCRRHIKIGCCNVNMLFGSLSIFKILNLKRCYLKSLNLMSFLLQFACCHQYCIFFFSVSYGKCVLGWYFLGWCTLWLLISLIWRSDISNRARVLLSKWSKLLARNQAIKKANGVKPSSEAQKEMLGQRQAYIFISFPCILLDLPFSVIIILIVAGLVKLCILNHLIQILIFL